MLDLSYSLPIFCAIHMRADRSLSTTVSCPPLYRHEAFILHNNGALVSRHWAKYPGWRDGTRAQTFGRCHQLPPSLSIC